MRKGIYINCIVCGKEVYVLPSHAGETKFCSRKCFDKRPTKENSKRKKKNCIVCGSEFHTYQESVRCCSIKCARESLKGKKRGGKKSKEVECPVCSKKIRLFDSQIKRGYRFCSTYCASKGCATRKGKKITDEHRRKVSENHHNVSGENNPNWKGGISREQTKYRNKTWKQYKEWRDSVLERDGHSCKDCGSKENLHAHHIVARKTLPEAEFIKMNGVTLCGKCHKKTDSWGGGVDMIPYNRKGKILKYVIKIIPPNWQAYPTDVNYFHIKSGLIVIFCSDVKDEHKHINFCAKAMIDSAEMLVEKIKSK